MLVAEAAERMSVQRVDSASELIALAEEWNAVAGDIPFLRHDWLVTWWRHYGQPADELFVVLVRSAEGELLGIAPWFRTGQRGLRTIRQLGSGEVASDYVGILSSTRHAAPVATKLARWLVEEAAGEWDRIEIDAVRRDDHAIATLVAGLRDCGQTVDEQRMCQTWVVPLAKSWDEYLAGISKSRREQLRRLMRRSLDVGRAELHKAETEADLERGLSILADLHQRRRESLGDQGCFASPRFVQFHEDVARRFCELGRLRLRWLEYEGRPAAIEYSLTGGDTVYYYQSGLDPALAEESPGWVALGASLRDAIDDGYRVFDFLRGDEPYKASLGGEPAPLVRWRIVGRSWLARTHRQMWRAGSQAKAWAKEGLRRLRGRDRASTRQAVKSDKPG